MFWRRKSHAVPEEKSWSVGEAPAELLELFGVTTASASGEAITAASALRVPAFLAGIRIIAETMASLPLHVFKRGDDGERERDREHPAATAIEQPTPWTSGYEFRLGLMTDALLHGQAFAVAVRASGKLREMHRLDPQALRIEIDEATGEPSYVQNRREGGDRRWNWSDVVHIVPIRGVAGAMPLSHVAAAGEAIGFAAVLQKHGAQLFKNGARPSGLLSFKGKMSADNLKNRAKLWSATHGANRSGGTAVLDEEASYTPLTINSVDAQFLELWRHNILEFARVFRLPPHMLAELDRATHTNSEQLGQQFATYCLRPWAKLVESAFSRVLFTGEERRTHFVEHSFDDLLRADLATRMRAYSTAISARILNPNEARASENRAPYAGGDEFLNPNIAPDAGSEEPADPPAEPNLRVVR